MNDRTREKPTELVNAQALRWQLVDARWLEPPEPMERVLAALDELRPGWGIRFLIHREPHPLYGVLQHMGYRYRAQWLEDGCFEVIIEAAPVAGSRDG